MIPNFEPQIILPKLASLVRPKDFLLFSANLAPGNNYAAGVKKILPQYDNPLTRDWLMTFLLDLGVERNDGKLRFKIETCRSRREEAQTSGQFLRRKTETPYVVSYDGGGRIETHRGRLSFHAFAPD